LVVLLKDEVMFALEDNYNFILPVIFVVQGKELYSNSKKLLGCVQTQNEQTTSDIQNYLCTFNSNHGNTYCLYISPSETTLTNLLFGRWWRGTARLRTRLPFLFITRSRTLPLSGIVTSLLTNKTITQSWKWLLRISWVLHIHIKAW
jgi:hypothetical protein